jgi:eukaryotic-like serine/threonine-protein kinase
METPKVIISQYQVIKLIGQGQFGKVFSAIDLNTGDVVALKEIENQRFSTHKFIREINFLVSLQHPNIVSCQGIKHSRSARYLVMEYCQGGSLRELLDAEHHLRLDRALKIIIDILSGLEYAHKKGIIHCDLKPENILLSTNNGVEKATISDFGIARMLHEEKLEAMGATGSPAYMAPERFYGKYSPSSDLYAVGVMLLEMVTGDRPFSGLPGKLLVAHLNEQVEISSTVPILIRKIITKALQKLPQKRFASATEMLNSIYIAAKTERPLTSNEMGTLAIDLNNLF